MRPSPTLALALLFLVAGCSSPAGNGAPSRTRPIAGIFNGTLANGGSVSWTLTQADTTITGTGTYTPLASGVAGARYAVRGVFRYDLLTLRLVGSPGDADADSVVYSAAFDAELYTAIAFDGAVTGGSGSPLAGQLQILRQSDITPTN
jgi:hypothetical protein